LKKKHRWQVPEGKELTWGFLLWKKNLKDRQLERAGLAGLSSVQENSRDIPRVFAHMLHKERHLRTFQGMKKFRMDLSSVVESERSQNPGRAPDGWEKTCPGGRVETPASALDSNDKKSNLGGGGITNQTHNLRMD